MAQQGDPRSFGLDERSSIDPLAHSTAENARHSERPLRVVPTSKAPGPARDGIAPAPRTTPASLPARPSLERLRRELELTREEIRHLHDMTLELPEIFENKFRQRLRETLRQQRLLIEDNASLRQKLLELGPAASHRVRPPLLLPPARDEQLDPLQPQARQGLMQSLKEAWGGWTGGRAADAINDDERTRDGWEDPRHR